mmetsp:Transcript_25818/g.39011  ORF Transcript_25818/g.39011 Transcript_25818/m.39011 type:complete len:95 (-) Transcript_25818:934-1218(-)
MVSITLTSREIKRMKNAATEVSVIKKLGAVTVLTRMVINMLVTIAARLSRLPLQTAPGTRSAPIEVFVMQLQSDVSVKMDIPAEIVHKEAAHMA